MKTSTVLLAVLCAINLHMAMGGVEELQECVKSFSSKIQGMMANAMAGGDMTKAKEEICPMMKNFMKCALRASSDNRPSDSELEDLKKQLDSSTETMKAIDCGLDINELADEVWNAAGVARPLSLVALALAAIAAMFFSRGL